MFSFDRKYNLASIAKVKIVKFIVSYSNLHKCNKNQITVEEIIFLINKMLLKQKKKREKNRNNQYLDLKHVFIQS